MDWLLQLLYFMLPAYLANMAPPFVKFWPGWNRPISRRWLGDHKTVMGFAAGVALGVLTAFVQSRIDWLESLWAPHDWFAVGLAMGFGALAGDAVKSFFKRRLGIAPGSRWIPADQLDFALGALLCVLPWVRLGWVDAAVLLGLTFVCDIAVNQISCRLRIRDSPW